MERGKWTIFKVPLKTNHSVILQVCGDTALPRSNSGDCYRFMLPSYKAERISSWCSKNPVGESKRGS